MSAVAFALVAGVFTLYVVLDGYDLGVAAVSPFIARTSAERAAAMAAIGPYWNGNEVFLIAGGAMLFALFPQAYASSFSGFYLPFIVVLWLLMGRGVSIELRGHLDSALWRGFWDACFTVSSILLVFVFGVAIANVVRGVPLDAAGYFRGTFGFLLNPYALLVGVFSTIALASHGAAFLAMRTEPAYGYRAARAGAVLWWATAVLFLAVTAATFAVRPVPLFGPLDVLFGLCIAALAGQRAVPPIGPWRFAFHSLFLMLALATAACTIYPYLLPSFPAGSGGLSVTAAAPSEPALVTSIVVFAAGLCVVAAYAFYLLRPMRAIVRVDEHDGGKPPEPRLTAQS